jgi:predicted metal-binding protein
MLITLKSITMSYTRSSKLGHVHKYKKTKIIAVLRCDNCGGIFERAKEKMSPARLNNNYFHVCGECDAKRFAQRKGAERRTIWDRPASSTDDISKL